MMGRRILSLAMEKACLRLINMTVRYLGGSDMGKMVTVSPRYFFPMVALPKVAWILPRVELLLSITIYGESVQIYFNLVPNG